MNDVVIVALIGAAAGIGGALFREFFAWVRAKGPEERDDNETIRAALYKEIDRLNSRVTAQDAEITQLRARIVHLEDENVRLAYRLASRGVE